MISPERSQKWSPATFHSFIAHLSSNPILTLEGGVEKTISLHRLFFSAHFSSSSSFYLYIRYQMKGGSLKSSRIFENFTVDSAESANIYYIRFYVKLGCVV